MRILVTGGTGFVGSHIVREAADAGHRVICLSRGIRRTRHPRGIVVVKVDLVRPFQLERQLAGVETVIHAVGILREGGGQSFERVHVGGTANLLDACRRAGVRKLVYLSSLGAQIRSPNPYLRTKAEAERVIEASGIAYTIFRPSLIFGSGDRLVSHVLRLMRASRVVPIVMRRGDPVQPIWVGDVATAVVRAAADDSSSGHCYELGGPEPMTYSDMVDLIKERTGISALSLPVPAQLAEPFAKLGQRLFRDPPLSSDQLELLISGGTCDPNPAAVTFGLRMRSLSDVLPEYRQAS